MPQLLDANRRLVRVPGTAQPLGPCIPCSFVDVEALSGNADVVVIGPAPDIFDAVGDPSPGPVAALATRRGKTLAAGASKRFAVDNLNMLWIDAVTADDGVDFEVYL